MTEAARSFDVVIAGAGLVGLALAPALARAGLRVALVDRAPIATPETPADDWDARVYAVSPGSAAFLHRLGAWQELSPERIAAIETMCVQGDDGATLGFSAYELGERSLAWIVEERALREALVPLLHAAGVELIAPARFETLSFSPKSALLALEGGERVAAQLLVGADGVNSWVRSAAGIMAEPRPYGQTAVVANFACERAHHGCARQWFLSGEGILAWLPLPGRRISIVWSAPEPLAQALLALDPAALCERVAAAGHQAQGALALITPPAAFPLRFLRLPSCIAHRLALVGDAAHGVHPLAGQGVNLGFGDAEALARVLAARGPVGDPGAPILLERYARARAEPVLSMQAVTDGLARLFTLSTPGLRFLRNAGMTAVDRLPLLKTLLAQPAVR
jgi:ubiquinone biosynthesis UbiH/UbiF/VisC/COQ6 family hydroxylase